MKFYRKKERIGNANNNSNIRCSIELLPLLLRARKKRRETRIFCLDSRRIRGKISGWKSKKEGIDTPGGRAYNPNNRDNIRLENGSGFEWQRGKVDLHQPRFSIIFAGPSVKWTAIVSFSSFQSYCTGQFKMEKKKKWKCKTRETWQHMFPRGWRTTRIFDSVRRSFSSSFCVSIPFGISAVFGRLRDRYHLSTSLYITKKKKKKGKTLFKLFIEVDFNEGTYYSSIYNYYGINFFSN